MVEYVGALERGLRDRNYAGDLLIAQSAGGLMGVEATQSIPVRTANSGPSAGAIAAREIGMAAVSTMSSASTSAERGTDVSVTQDGAIRTTQAWEVEWGHPILFPAVDIITVGAGGGSVAWFDAGGKLRNGLAAPAPRPGPLAIGKAAPSPRTPTRTWCSATCDRGRCWEAPWTSLPSWRTRP